MHILIRYGSVAILCAAFALALATPIAADSPFTLVVRWRATRLVEPVRLLCPGVSSFEAATLNSLDGTFTITFDGPSVKFGGGVLPMYTCPGVPVLPRPILPGRIVGYRGGNSVTWEFDYGPDAGVLVWDLFPGQGEKDVWFWAGSLFRFAVPFFGLTSVATLQ